MNPTYLLAALSLALSDPLSLLAETLAALVYLHLAGAGGYLVYRMMGGGWDGLAWGARVLSAVHELRTTPLTHTSDVPTSPLHPLPAHTRRY